MRITFFSTSLLLILVCSHICFAQFSTQNAYIASYEQKTEIFLKDSVPYTETNIDIVFKFISEKAIATFHNYSVYYSHFDELTNLKVFTKNPDAKGKVKTLQITKFEERNAKSGGVFYDDMTEIGIPLLGLVVGSEAYVSYTILTKEMHFTDPIIYRSFLPIQLQTHTLKVPKALDVAIINKNVPPNFVEYSKSVKSNYVLHTWQAKDVEEEKAMPDAPGRLWYTPHTLYKIETINLSSSKVLTYSKTPKDIFNWYKQHIQALRKTPTTDLQLLADSIVRNCNTEQEKTAAIFKWVQQKIRYVAFEAGMEGLIPREAALVCDRRYGDCKDMANLTKTLLQAVGIPAYLASIGTRSLPYTYSELPLKNTDNHMICVVLNNGKYVFLDATDSHCPFGLPTSHIQGKQALIYKSDSTFDLETVPVIDAATNVVKAKYILNVLNNNIDVQVNTNYNGMHISAMANRLQYLAPADMEEFAKGTVKANANNAILSKFQIPTLEDIGEKDFSYNYTITNHVKSLEKEIFINMFMSKNYATDAIINSRLIPVERDNNTMDSTMFILNIPSGYKLTYVPDNVKFGNDKYGFEIMYQRNKDDVTCSMVIYINLPKLLLEPSDFDTWNQFVKKLSSAYKESIILEKTP
jgi:hypothetical protein